MDTPTTTRAPGPGDMVGNAKNWVLGGLALMILGGILGTFFDEGSDGAKLFYSIAGLGGLAATTLLAVRHLRAGRELAAAGFAGIAIVFSAEAVAGFSGPSADLVFVSMAILHLPPLWLVAAQEWSPAWSRGAAALSGLAFALYGYIYTLGDDAPDTDNPIIIAAWALFIVASIGWLMTVREEA